MGRMTVPLRQLRFEALGKGLKVYIERWQEDRGRDLTKSSNEQRKKFKAA